MHFNPNFFDQFEKKFNLKTDLFTKTIKVQKLNQELERVLLLSPANRQKWMDDNEPFLTQMMEELTQDSGVVLEGIDGDVQEMNLSVEYVSSLRDAMSTLSSLLYGKDFLEI